MSDNREVVNSYTETANKLRVQGSFSKAAQAYRSAIELEPDNVRLYHFLGDVLAQDGEYDEAIIQFSNAIVIDPNFASPHHRLGDVFQAKGCYEKAIIHYSNAIRLNSKNYRSYFALGRALACQKQWSDAVAAYEQAISIDSNDARVYHHMADALIRLRRHKDAILYFKKAVELDPDLAVAHHRLGDVLQNQGNINEAITSYYRAIELNSKNFWSYFNLGSALDKQDRNAEAVQCYRKAIELNPRFAEAHCNLGYALTRQGKLEQAINSYQNSSREYILASHPKILREYVGSLTLTGPDFIVIGSMKAGTTSLYKYISQHPQFLPCIRKEIDFFSIRYDKGIDWYLAHFPRKPTDSTFFTGEASTSYLDYPEVAQRLHSHFPNLKLIVILRNPIERAFSHYHHNIKYHPGKEQRSFEEAVSEEMKMLDGLQNPALQATSNPANDPFAHLRYGYLLRGMYVYYLEQWAALFQNIQMLVLKSENFYESPGTVLQRVSKFLEIPDYQLGSYPQYNSGSYSSPIADEVRRKAGDFFRLHNKRLEDFLKIKFGWD